ncbi:hypothetical protein [Spirillospora sp. CA-294931]|uniref:hypothetical protein n=1 Tax=Spirillospora sp. CA-294931 TaxID=3240042 RepID=UPI003D8A3561
MTEKPPIFSSEQMNPLLRGERFADDWPNAVAACQEIINHPDPSLDAVMKVIADLRRLLDDLEAIRNDGEWWFRCPDHVYDKMDDGDLYDDTDDEPDDAQDTGKVGPGETWAGGCADQGP